MKRLAACAVTMVPLCVIGLGEVLALDIVKDGKPAAMIVTPDRPNAIVEEAAKLLAEHVRLASGAELPVLNESVATNQAPVRIHIGPTKAAVAAKFPMRELQADGYFMRAAGGTLYLLGRDDPDVKDVKASFGAKGTLCAAMDFLREFVGVRWLTPSPKGTWTPSRNAIAAPDNLDRTHIPLTFYGTPRFDNCGYPWSLANGARKAARTMGEEHTWYRIFPPSQYAAQYPDLYALKGANRMKDANNPSLCTTHPRFKPMVIAWIQARFDEGYDIVPLGEADAYESVACECANCTARFGDAHATNEVRRIEAIARRIYEPHREICEALLTNGPQKKVQVLVYGAAGAHLAYGGGAVTPFPANTLAQVTDLSPAALDTVQKVFPTITAYTYFWNDYTSDIGPRQTVHSISAQMRKLIRSHSLGTYFCGGGNNWPAEGPTYYAGFRTLQDPTLDPDALLQEYCVGLYGKAARKMEDYFRLLYSLIEIEPTNARPDCAGLFPGVPEERLIGEKYVRFWPKENLPRLDRLLTEAQAAASGDDRALNMIRVARFGFEYIRATANGYHAYRAFETHPTRDGFKQIVALIEVRHALIESVRTLIKQEPAFVSEYFGNPYYGFRDGCGAVGGGNVAWRLGPPFAWDVAPPRPGNLAADWKMNENAGAIVHDATPNANNGTIHGAFWTAGRSGSGLLFDGDADYVDCGNGASLSIPNATTIEAWVNVADFDNNRAVVNKGSAEAKGGYDVMIRRDGVGGGGRLHWILWDPKGAARYVMAPQTLQASVTTGAWHHVAATYDGLDKMRIYLDGLQVTPDSECGAFPIGVVTNSVTIGLSGYFRFKGTMDEVRIHNKALTAVEIFEHARPLDGGPAQLAK